MKIRINKNEYHLGNVNYNNYKILDDIKDKFANLDRFLLNKIAIATIKENYSDIEKLDYDATKSFLVRKINEKLPMVLKNEKFLSSGHCCLYEKNTVTSLYKSRSFMSLVNRKIMTLTDNYRVYYVLLCNNVLRILVGIISLIAVGDDVHAMSLLRSFIESEAKLDYLDKYDVKNDFVLFNDYNAELQTAKLNDDFSNLSEDFLKLLNKNNLSVKSGATENFLLYGWMNGKKQIRNATELTKFISNNDPDVMKTYHLTCEFVHEDYIGTQYNYEEIRRIIIELLPHFTESVTERLGKIFNK